MITGSIDRSHYQMNLSNGRHHFLADEPIETGGTDMAPSPTDFLHAALVSCTLATIRMYADRKQWPVENVEVTVDTQQENGITTFTKKINLIGNLTQEQKERILVVSKSCPISKILEGKISIHSALK